MLNVRYEFGPVYGMKLLGFHDEGSTRATRSQLEYEIMLSIRQNSSEIDKLLYLSLCISYSS